MTVKIGAKFWKKLTCGVKNDMINVVNFHQNT